MLLAEFLVSRAPILFDGAMGTQLAAAGLEMGGQNNLSHPDQVLAVHRGYVAAGCHLLITNTLTMNRIYIETHGVGVDVREVNLAGVRLARAATTGGQFILGDLSSTGALLAPHGDYSEARFEEAFREQAACLAEGGVDGFSVETMFDLREALCAVRACREVSWLPVLATIAFRTPQRGGRTIMGDRAADCAVRLAGAGASAVGANCGDLSPLEMAAVVAEMRAACALPVIAQPNAGKPELIGERTVFRMGPAEFAEGITACLRSGASLVGGCCGTTPEHIRACRPSVPPPDSLSTARES
jgi:5-methyltetrahydrofolate--homocysteine methyltransferase